MPERDPPSPAEATWLRLLRDRRRFRAWAEQTRAAWRVKRPLRIEGDLSQCAGEQRANTTQAGLGLQGVDAGQETPKPTRKRSR